MVREDFAVLHLYARDVLVGDELLVGPQGRIEGNPTIVHLRHREDGAIVATLRDDDGEDTATWLPDSPLTIYRTGGPS